MGLLGGIHYPPPLDLALLHGYGRYHLSIDRYLARTGAGVYAVRLVGIQLQDYYVLFVAQLGEASIVAVSRFIGDNHCAGHAIENLQRGGPVLMTVIPMRTRDLAHPGIFCQTAAPFRQFNVVGKRAQPELREFTRFSIRFIGLNCGFQLRRQSLFPLLTAA
jgi:hypothetical protein